MRKIVLVLLGVALPVLASSHREAPAITGTPKVDATDFYMFSSYEKGREDFVTLIANYIPLQDPYGGPNYFTLDPTARYEIKVDNDGDAVEDITFRFQFQVQNKNIALAIGNRSVAVPLINVGAISAGSTAALNRTETFTLDVIRRRGSARGTKAVVNAENGSETFVKPVDNIGLKSIEDYGAYADAHVYDVTIPGCHAGSRVFVGQRKDPFVVNLGEVFDLVNIDPLGARDAERDDLADKNVTSLILEVPKACLKSEPDEPVIGAWTTASLPRSGDRPAADSQSDERPGSVSLGSKAGFRQVSRLSSPLVNEVVIGLKDKDKFNSSEPKDDAQFLTYVTHPTLPALLAILFPVQAPNSFPRTDLVRAFLTGLPGLNQTATPAEMLRLNTDIAAVPAKGQDSLGALGRDFAGFPNGRRPGDDVVDIELRVAMGVLLDSAVAPSGNLPFTDGAYVDASFFDERFPYLKTPIPGSPSEIKDGK